jgi:hypothetical protein
MPKKKTANLFEKAPRGYKWKNVRTLVKDEVSKVSTNETKSQKSKADTEAPKARRKVSSK